MTRWTLCLVLLAFAACGVDAPAPSLDTNAAGLVTADAMPDGGPLGCGGGCPTTWAEARTWCAGSLPAGLSCTGFGEHCSYPGAGDQLPDGTWATAALFCFDTSGTGAGPGEWRCAQ